MANPANASFTSIVWDDLRRTCTITAKATGAAQMRIAAGYAPNSFTIADQTTAGDTGTLVIKDLNHGPGKYLYLYAVPLAADNSKFSEQEILRTEPIPNPILGVKTPACGSGKAQEYIVDIIEHKANNTCTPRWQTGDRVASITNCAKGVQDLAITAPTGSAGKCLNNGNPFFGNLQVLSDGWVNYTFASPGTTVTTGNTGLTSWGLYTIAFDAPTTGRLSFDFSWAKPGHKYKVRLLTRNGTPVTPMPTETTWWRIEFGSVFTTGLSFDGQWNDMDLTNLTTLPAAKLSWYWTAAASSSPKSPWPYGAAATSGFDFRLEYQEVS